MKQLYKNILDLLERAEHLVGNPLTNISGSTDIACIHWQNDYAELKKSLVNSSESELKLAVNYLKSRAVRSDKVSKQLLKQFVAVIPVSEVESVLKIALSGDFVSFYNEYNKQRTDETDQG